MKATGNVKYYNDEITVYAETAKYQGVDGDIKFSNAKYFRSQNIGAGKSENIVFKKNKDIHLESATYTACNIDDPDWELTSTSTKLLMRMSVVTHIICCLSIKVFLSFTRPLSVTHSQINDSLEY